MEVTNKNFNENLDLISKTIEDASFLAVDTEFTGLTTDGSVITGLDTPAERYRKLRQSAVDFMVVQFGLAAYQYDAESKTYSVKTFNFYTFPRPFSRQSTEVRFLCQSSSMEFLASQAFDFNKLFKYGITSMLPQEETRLRTALEDKYRQLDAQQQHRHSTSPAFTSPSGLNDSLSFKGPSIVPAEHRDFIDGVCRKIENFVKSGGEEFSLEPCNGYLRKLIYQTVAIKFRTDVHLEAKTAEGHRRYIQVSRVRSEEDMKKKEEAKRAAEFQELSKAVGFSKVVRMISQSKKLVVGHNMMLDLMHILHQFVCPLPREYEEFKSLARCIFPWLLDTKLLAAEPSIKDYIPNSTLQDLQKTLSGKPFKQPTVACAEDFPHYNTDTECLHEAGYDAYITGQCFITMAEFLGTFKMSETPCIDPVAPNSPALQHLVNKLYLMKVYDIPYITLDGPDASPCRSHVFHLVFPAEWKAADVSQLFSPFGGIQIVWLDDTSAFVSLYRKDQADFVLRKIAVGEGYRVISYKDYVTKKTLEATPTQSLKRKPPSSDIDLPVKKRRSGSLESPQCSNRSLTAIPEEVEEEKMEASAGGPAGVQPATSNGDDAEADDWGIPLKRKMMDVQVPACQSSTDAKTDGKMFDEPEAW